MTVTPTLIEAPGVTEESAAATSMEMPAQARMASSSSRRFTSSHGFVFGDQLAVAPRRSIKSFACNRRGSVFGGLFGSNVSAACCRILPTASPPA